MTFNTVSLVTTHQAAIPTWLEALSGNSDDKRSFPQTVSAYQKQLAPDKASYFVADSALYSKANLRQLSTVFWVTRVPLTLKSARRVLAASGPVAGQPKAEGWEEIIPGYQGREYGSIYGGVKQRWWVIFSQAAYDRESKTFARKLAKAEAKAQSALAKLEKETFACQPDAEQAVAKAAAKWRYHRPVIQVEPVLGYGQRGRPAKGSEPTIQGYRITGEVVTKADRLAELEQKRGKFIIATNQLQAEKLPAEKMLSVYKAQGVTAERGFRFLKDPMFFADSLFLKKPSRLMALLMVMGLSLLVYALAERQLRQALAENNQTIPDQVGKPTQRPTMRRVFQMFEGIDLLIIMIAGQIAGRQVLNLRPVHEQIVTLLGPAVKNIYIPPD